MTYHEELYIVCTNCKTKQYIGKDLYLAKKLVSKLTSHIVDNISPEHRHLASDGLLGLGESLELILSFIKYHHNHKIVLWNSTLDEDQYDSYENEWIFTYGAINGSSVVGGSFDKPTWHGIKPLPSVTPAEDLLQAECNKWKNAYEAERITRYNLEKRQESDPRKLLELKRQIETFAVEMKARTHVPPSHAGSSFSVNYSNIVPKSPKVSTMETMENLLLMSGAEVTEEIEEE